MKQESKGRFSGIFSENFSYKLVALFISLILWLTILGRRDFVLTKTIEVELLVNPQYQLVAQTSDIVRVKVSGPRSALKKFSDSNTSQLITLDLGDRGPGIIDVSIPIAKIDLPFGVKLISVRPNIIRAEIVKLSEKK